MKFLNPLLLQVFTGRACLDPWISLHWKNNNLEIQQFRNWTKTSEETLKGASNRADCHAGKTCLGQPGSSPSTGAAASRHMLSVRLQERSPELLPALPPGQGWGAPGEACLQDRRIIGQITALLPGVSLRRADLHSLTARGEFVFFRRWITAVLKSFAPHAPPNLSQKKWFRVSCLRGCPLVVMLLTTSNPQKTL